MQNIILPEISNLPTTNYLALDKLNNINPGKVKERLKYLSAVIDFNQYNKAQDYNNIKQIGQEIIHGADIFKDYASYLLKDNPFIWLNEIYLTSVTAHKLNKANNNLLLEYNNLFESGNNLLNIRNIIYVAANTEATVIEYYHDTVQNTLTNSNTIFILHANAKLQHYIVTDHAAIQLASVHYIMHDHSSLRSYGISLGNNTTNLELVTQCMGLGCKAEMFALQLSELQAIHNINLIINHNKPNCSSQVTARGICNDKSQAAITGNINVAKYATDTAANFQNKYLLLSPSSRAYSRPILEIANDSVQCTHGSSSGPINKDAMFYLQSRGIEAGLAEKIIAKSFIAPIINKIKNAIIEKLIQKSIPCFDDIY